MSMNMFDQHDEQQALAGAPLATRMRPNSLHTYVGQEHLIGKGKVLRRAIEADRIPSMIFWGPPGCGKTTLAFIIASSTGSSAPRAPPSTTSARSSSRRRSAARCTSRRPSSS